MKFIKSLLTAMLSIALLLAAAVPAFAATCSTGDANGDGETSLKDVVVMIRHLAGYDVSIDTVGADIFHDGEVTLKDATCLIRILAGYKDVPTGQQGEIQVTTEPTCTEPGEGTLACSICETERTVEVDPLGHDIVRGACTRCEEKTDAYEYYVMADWLVANNDPEVTEMLGEGVFGYMDMNMNEDFTSGNVSATVYMDSSTFEDVEMDVEMDVEALEFSKSVITETSAVILGYTVIMPMTGDGAVEYIGVVVYMTEEVMAVAEAAMDKDGNILEIMSEKYDLTSADMEASEISEESMEEIRAMIVEYSQDSMDSFKAKMAGE